MSGRRGALIVVTNHTLSCVEAGVFGSAVFLTIEGRDGPVTVDSFYSPPSSDLQEDVNEWLVEMERGSLLIGGDFNAKNRLGILPK